MKTLRKFTVALMLMVVSSTLSAQPMSVYSMRSNARFLTDRMAYTLGLSTAILDDLYCINYDYICGVNDYLDQVALGYRYDDYMTVVFARDYALRRLLTERQWALLMTYDYFYRPITFADHRWHFSIYAHDHRMDHFFFNPPRRFNEYRGGAFFVGMRAGEPGRGDMPDRGGMHGNVGNMSHPANGYRFDGNRFDGNQNVRNQVRSDMPNTRNQASGSEVGVGDRRGVTVNTRGGVTVNTRNGVEGTRSSSTRTNSTATQRSIQVNQRNMGVGMDRSAGTRVGGNTRSVGTGRTVSNGRR